MVECSIDQEGKETHCEEGGELRVKNLHAQGSGFGRNQPVLNEQNIA